MHPKLFTIPGLNLPIYSYGFMVMLGFLIGIIIASRRAKKEGINPEFILDLGIVVMIAGIVGARLLYIIVYSAEFARKNSWEIFNLFDGNINMVGLIIGWFVPAALLWKSQIKITIRKFIWLLPVSFISAVVVGRIVDLVVMRQDYDFSLFKIWEGGLVFYGGLMLAIPAGMYYINKKDLQVWKVGDIVAPSVVLGLAFGRIGCFLNGCCYGKIAETFPLAVSFPNFNQPETLLKGSPAFLDHFYKHLVGAQSSGSLPVYPIQLAESVFAVCLFVALSLIARKKPRTGTVLGLMVLLYSAGRFTIEFWRGDKWSVVFGLTDAQIISVVLFLASLFFLIYIFRKPSQLHGMQVNADNSWN